MFEQLGCGRVGVGEFGLHPVVLVLQPFELLLCVGAGVLVICELTLERLERGFGLAAGGFDQADSFEQLRAGDTGVSELRLELLVVLLQLLELSLGGGGCSSSSGAAAWASASSACTRSCSSCSRSSCCWARPSVLVICELTLERLQRGFGLAAGGFDQADPFEQLRAGGWASIRKWSVCERARVLFGSVRRMLFELLLGGGPCVLLIGELALERLECGFGLAAGGFDQADSFEQLRTGDTGVSELCLQLLVVVL